MFEITTRRNPVFHNPIRDLMEFVTNDPFFRGATAVLSEEGNLALDISEENGDIVVRASMPGFRKEDVDVQVHNGVLSIKADHTEETETKDAHYYRRERRVGSMSRRIALPGVVTEANANAELKDGILTLRIPHAEVAKPKQIKIK